MIFEAGEQFIDYAKELFGRVGGFENRVLDSVANGFRCARNDGLVQFLFSLVERVHRIERNLSGIGDFGNLRPLKTLVSKGVTSRRENVVSSKCDLSLASLFFHGSRIVLRHAVLISAMTG